MIRASFFVSGNPLPKGSFRYVGHRRNGEGRSVPVVLNDDPDLEEWEAAIGWGARAAGVAMVSAAAVELVFDLPRRPSVKRDVPAVKPDLDKLARAVLDGLTGIAWSDDGAVVQLRASKRYAAPGALPGVHIAIEEFREGNER